jgi:hypothetical protein
VPAVLLAEWDLQTDYFDGATLNGPVPRLFAAQPDEARSALLSDPAKAFKDLQRIHSRLFIAENIPASEAWSFVGNPRQDNVTVNARVYLQCCSRQTLHCLILFCLYNGCKSKGIKRLI